MRECIYCRNQKDDDEFTLEHVLPQFIGGAYAPDELKTRDVCKKCNSNLGLFVDAGFEKSWLVHNHLKSAAHAFFNPEKPTGLPFVCMGSSDLQPPEMSDGEVCELWLGPLGERVYWIRETDERLYWYSGGNPRTVKKKKSRAYFIFSERSNKNIVLSWLSFKECFEGKKVKKIMCSTVEGADPLKIGFSNPDELDHERINYFFTHTRQNEREVGSAAMYLHYDIRFLAKIAIGVSYCLFGKKILNTDYMQELNKALWYRQGEELPNVNFGSNLRSKDDGLLSEMLGCENAVTLTLLPNPVGLGINLNISSSLNWVAQCALNEDLDDEDLQKIGNGLVIVLFKTLQKGIALEYPDFLAYKIGSYQHDGLNEIYNQMGKHKDYFKNL